MALRMDLAGQLLLRRRPLAEGEEQLGNGLSMAAVCAAAGD